MRRTWTQDPRPAAPIRRLRGSVAPAAGPPGSCPVSTLGSSARRPSAARAPPAAWVSTPPVGGPAAWPPSHERRLGPAGLAERVLEASGHAALDHRPPRGQVLSHRGQSQGVQAQERRQVRAGEGSLRHVEVSRDGVCRNSHHRGTSTPTHRNDAPTTPTKQINRPYLLHPQTRRARNVAISGV